MAATPSEGTHRVLVTGSRDWPLPFTLRAYLNQELIRAHARGEQMVVVHGGAQGADRMAARWAAANGVRAEQHDPQWRWNGVYNPQAGLARNRHMVSLGADICLAFIHNGSRGATHCANEAELAHIETWRIVSP